MFYSLSQYRRESINWNSLACNVTFVLYLCNGIKKYIDIEIIAEQAARTYPNSFVTKIGKRNIPDTYAVVKALETVKSINFRFVKGDWINGWKLARRGLYFAKDVERKKLKK